MSFRTRLRRLLQPPSTNYDLGRGRVKPYEGLAPGSVVLDLGAGSTAGAYAFAARTGAVPSGIRFVTVDIDLASSASIRGDAHAIPLTAASVDCVVCVSVVEYLRDPFAAAREIHRVLKPGGRVYLSAPFVFPYHPPPPDLYRFSMAGLRTLMAGFEELQVGYNRGPASTFTHILVHFLAIAGSFGSARAYGLLLDAAKWLLFWIKYLDRWIGHYPSAATLHNGAFFLGRKPVAR